MAKWAKKAKRCYQCSTKLKSGNILCPHCDKAFIYWCQNNNIVATLGTPDFQVALDNWTENLVPLTKPPAPPAPKPVDYSEWYKDYMETRKRIARENEERISGMLLKQEKDIEKRKKSALKKLYKELGSAERVRRHLGS